MATYSVTRAKNATLTGTTVDTVTIKGTYQKVEILNRDATNTVWVTLTPANVPNVANLPIDPVAAADEAFPVPPSTAFIYSHDGASALSYKVKILGNGGAYSVIGVADHS